MKPVPRFTNPSLAKILGYNVSEYYPSIDDYDYLKYLEKNNNELFLRYATIDSDRVLLNIELTEINLDRAKLNYTGMLSSDLPFINNGVLANRTVHISVDYTYHHLDLVEYKTPYNQTYLEASFEGQIAAGRNPIVYQYPFEVFDFTVMFHGIEPKESDLVSIFDVFTINLLKFPWLIDSLRIPCDPSQHDIFDINDCKSEPQGYYFRLYRPDWILIMIFAPIIVSLMMLTSAVAIKVPERLNARIAIVIAIYVFAISYQSTLGSIGKSLFITMPDLLCLDLMILATFWLIISVRSEKVMKSKFWSDTSMLPTSFFLLNLSFIFHGQMLHDSAAMWIKWEWAVYLLYIFINAAIILPWLSLGFPRKIVFRGMFIGILFTASTFGISYFQKILEADGRVLAFIYFNTMTLALLGAALSFAALQSINIIPENRLTGYRLFALTVYALFAFTPLVLLISAY